MLVLEKWSIFSLSTEFEKHFLLLRENVLYAHNDAKIRDAQYNTKESP